MFLTVAIAHFRWKLALYWTKLDIAIGFYIAIMIFITLFTTGVSWILYGGRYDFAFLITFLVVYHGFFFLEKPASYYYTLFLLSGGLMLFISMLLKWPLSEDLLLYLGYSGNPSNWQFGSSIPIFHGVDGANVRRFQGLLDGPNTMGAFLLIFMGIVSYFFRNKKDWYFLLGLGLALCIGLILYTYSRSAFLGLLAWVWVGILIRMPFIYRKYRIQFFTLVALFLLLLGTIFLQYAWNMRALIERGWSTNGHIERMVLGVNRFFEHPLGQWLWSAGPAYRYVEQLQWKERKEIEELDRYYVPESWYIQQMIEWWAFWFLAFMSIMLLLCIRLYRTHIILFALFIAISVMNFFLHTYESSIVSLSLYSILALVLAQKSHHARER